MSPRGARFIRAGHGAGAGREHVEPPPHDELAAGVVAPAGPLPVRNAAGQFQPGAGTREAARAGGKAAGESKQLARLLTLDELPEGHPHAPYSRLAREWRDGHMAQLAAMVGGGEVGPGPASIISSAALQLAAARWCSDLAAQTGDVKLMLDSSKLANDSRQNVLAAHSLCALEAEATKEARSRSGQHTPGTLAARLAQHAANGRPTT